MGCFGIDFEITTPTRCQRAKSYENHLKSWWWRFSESISSSRRLLLDRFAIWKWSDPRCTPLVNCGVYRGCNELVHRGYRARSITRGAPANMDDWSFSPLHFFLVSVFWELGKCLKLSMCHHQFRQIEKKNSESMVKSSRTYPVYPQNPINEDGHTTIIQWRRNPAPVDKRFTPLFCLGFNHRCRISSTVS